MKKCTAILGVVSVFFFPASYCEAQKIEVVGMIVGLDNDQRVITLEQRRAVTHVVKSDMQIAKEVWADVALAVGDEVEACYDVNLAMIVAIIKRPPVPPEEDKRRQLRDAAALFLRNRTVLLRNLQQKQQQNGPALEQWRAVNAERWQLQQTLLRTPKKIVQLFDIVDNPEIAVIQRNIQANERLLLQLQPRYVALHKGEQLAIDAIVRNTETLVASLHPITGRNGLEQDKREALVDIKAKSPEMWEIDVWTAMIDLLGGDLDPALSKLKAVSTQMEDASFLVIKRKALRPVPPPFLYETAHIYICALRLADQASMLNAFVTKWEKGSSLDDQVRLVILKGTAARSICQGKWRQALQSYRKAVKIVQTDEVWGRTYGEAALLFAACPDLGERNMELAMDYAEKAIGMCGDSCWEAYRAKAAVHAANGEWDEASECLDVAGKSLPQILTEDLKAQRLSYDAEQDFAVTHF